MTRRRKTNTVAARSTPLQAPDIGPIEQVPIGSLKPYPGNARTHDDRQLAKIAQSLQAFGWMNPLIADGEGVIIAGHGRWLAAGQLGLAQVPVVRIDHLTPDAVKAYRIADNKLGDLSRFDTKALAVELKALATIDLEVDILDLTAFETAEIDLVIAGQDEPEPDAADDYPDADIGPPVSRPGDLWRLGGHRLLCGSALDEGAYRQLMGEQLARASFSDPPYNVPVQGHIGGRGRIKHGEFVQGAGEMSADQFVAFLLPYLRLTRQFCVDGALIYSCMDAPHSFELLAAARQAGLVHKTTCTWAKTNAGMGSLYRVQTEFVHVFKSGTAPHVNNVELGRHGRSRTTLWTYPGVNTFRRGRMEELSLHPTVKPAALLVDAVKDCSHRGDLILDPFMGSGTTIIAAERTGRRGYGLELDPVYVDVAVRRWERFTGHAAVHEASGCSFAELARERQGEVTGSTELVEAHHG